MSVRIKRAYEPPSDDDGERVLVDRLWPRGVSKQALRVDAWMKEIAPSTELRKAFHGGAVDWAGFRRRYLAELKRHREDLRPLARRARRNRVTLLYGRDDARHNHAVVLRQYLRMLGAR